MLLYLYTQLLKFRWNNIIWPLGFQNSVRTGSVFIGTGVPKTIWGILLNIFTFLFMHVYKYTYIYVHIHLYLRL